jgi:hypothetical protein
MVHVRSEREAELFRAGLASFLCEARMLARFDHPALVRMHRTWEEHGTAYTVMPYYEGITLKALRDKLAGVPDESLLERLLERLLGALDVLHAANVYHRDISPDNILVQPDGRPVLLDFGAARQVIADRTQSLTSILKPSFAPIEQYSGSGELRQGPWTDLYSLGAVMYFMIVGHAPPPAAARALDDDLPLLAQLARDGVLPISTPLAAVVDWCLEFRPQRRPQSVAEALDALAGRATPPSPTRRERASPHDRAAAGDSWLTTVDIDPHRDRAHARMRPPMPAPRRALAVTALPVAILLAGWGMYRHAEGTGTRPPAVAAAPATKARTAAPLPASQATPAGHVAKVSARAPRPPASTPPAPPSARAACGDRNVFSMSMCLRATCTRPQFRTDPSCVALADADRRQQETMQRY